MKILTGNALALIQSWINKSSEKVSVIPRTDFKDKCDEILGISEHSSLGTLVNHTGGMSVANGKIRHFGGSNQYDLSIKIVNQLNNKYPTAIPDILIVADDVFGGLFGININTKARKTGCILYLPPDSYVWENLDVGHTAFLEWSINGNTSLFFKKYAQLNIPDIIPFNKTVSFSPPLWANENSSINNYSTSQIDSKKSHAIRAGIINQLS